MPTSLPPSVREHFGEPVAEDFARWLEESLQERTVRRDERPDRKGGSTPGVYREVLSRLDVIDERFEQVDRRFEGVDAKLDRMNDRILSMTRWLIGLVALFGTLVTALLVVAQFGGNGEQRGWYSVNCHLRVEHAISKFPNCGPSFRA